MAVNNAINTAGLGSGFVYSDGLGSLSAPGGVIVTKFTANGTWTKDAKTQSVTVIAWNGGSGGGSGRRGLTTAAGGGAGGGAGSYIVWSNLSSVFGATETVTIGVGGAGGAAQTSNSTNGNVGTNGTESRLGNIAIFQLVNFGNAGTATSAAGRGSSAYNDVYNGSSFSSTTFYIAGNGSNTSSNVDAVNQYWSRSDSALFVPVLYNSAGGGGSGADSSVTRQAGNGGAMVFPESPYGSSTEGIVSAGGTGGIETGTINGGVGNNAISTTGGRYVGATGGGGGGGQRSGGAAGIGGAGGIPGAGGGGGGGSLNGTNSGAGGAGGRGEVWVIEYLG